MTPPNPVENDDRDLTDWLVRQLNANLLMPEIAEIRNLNTAAAIVTRGGIVVGKTIAVVTDSRVCALAARGGMEAAAMALRAEAGWRRWKPLVEDRALMDYKHAILSRMGKSIRLCHSTGCEWLDYSTPGNINYGYIGRAAGFPAWQLHLGASYAEMCDPAHGIDTERCPWNERYANPAWAGTFYDDPTDFQAINLGIELYQYYPMGPTEAGFKQVLQRYVHLLQQWEIPDEAYYNKKFGTRYPVGHFNGPSVRPVLPGPIP